MRVVFLVPGESGCDFYRAIQPAIILHKHKLATIQMVKKGDGEDCIFRFLEDTDIIVFQRPLDKKVLNLCKTKIKKVVVDYDDNLFDISPFNPVYKNLGIKEVKYSFPDGTKIELWKDGMKDTRGEVIFDINKNKEHLEIMRDILIHADLVTTTTPYLAKIFKKFNKNVAVLPNAINLANWMRLPLVKTDEIRIGWMGGWSHYEDWYSIAEPLSEVFKRYSYLNLRLVLFGHHFRGTTKNILADKVEFYPWEKSNAYPLKLASLNLDIGIIPLIDTKFNRCKSSIKFYELSALKIPAVISNVPPYNIDVRHNETGLLYNNSNEFIDCLSKLIDDKILRQEMGETAYKWVRYHKNIDVLIGQWILAYKKIL